MPLHAGTRLGAYEIVAPLGAGGMGEVYRARDASLGREVAIKILPESFVDDPERVARFEREAQLLAALNHPHIAAIYGLERLADTPFLVLELVDGETLADRLEGPTGKGLGLEESLSIARQIADALQAAHEKGIVHRDLKPANIALTRDGAVKVLDFGLARQDPASGGSGGLTHSPTLTVAHTQAGVILGTAAYMSPEQAKGRIADKRSDVWSFGCVLYEMLTGTRAFEGEDISETLAAILRAEPDWTRLPEDIPSPIRALVERCRMLAFTMRDDAGKVLIWLRPIDALAARPLIGTDAAEFPFWSPDGRGLGYFAHDKLMRIDAAGGPPQTICAAGGEPVVLTKAEVGNHRFPSFLPDGRHVLLAASTIGTPDKTGLYVTALDSPQPKRLAAADSSAVYASPGFLLFARQATLLAQPFNLKTLDLTGEPTPIAERVESGVFDAMLAFSVSDSGTLAYGLGTGRDPSSQLMWFDRQGRVLQPVGPPSGSDVGVELSPDETQAVVHRHDQGTGGDLWLIDLARGTTSRFTFDAAQDNSSPVWSPDGSRIAYASLRDGRWGLYVKPSNGTAPEELLTQASPVCGCFLLPAIANLCQ